MELTKERHWELLDSGMYWEWFPEGTGLYLNDKQMIEEWFDKHKVRIDPRSCIKLNVTT